MAIPPRLHVFVIFMLQFILVLGLVGIGAPWLHSEKGLPWIVLVPAAIAALVLLLFLISALGNSSR